MSDLISRDALLKEFDNYNQGNALAAVWRLRQLITNAPAIEQGEVVIDKAAYDGAREDLSIWKRRALEAEEKVRKYDQRIVDIGVIAMTPVTTPQQPQEQGELIRKAVADVMKEVISIVWDVMDNPELSGLGYCNDLEGRILALIKRNAVKKGE